MNQPPPQFQPLSPAELAAFRARQKSRSRALALVLFALVVLFFAITIVKIKKETAMQAAMKAHPAAPAAQGPASPTARGK
jgi:hypothetical protein